MNGSHDAGCVTRTRKIEGRGGIAINLKVEIEFTWADDVRQYFPVSPVVYRQLLRAKPVLLFLNRLMASRSVRERQVRTEAGRALMARELEELIV